MRPKRTIPQDMIDCGVLLDRFWSKVAVGDPEDCWPFTGCISTGGYGHFTIERHVHFTHRVAWALWNERDVPDGMRVLHRCDNRPCCNPAHLFLGSLSDNMRDMWSKGRHAPPVNKSGRDWTTPGTGRLKGEAHLSAKLTAADVLLIRQHGDTATARSRLAAQYGVTYQNIAAIVRRRTWKHI